MQVLVLPFLVNNKPVVIIVDCDLQSPRLHRYYGDPATLTPTVDRHDAYDIMVDFAFKSHDLAFFILSKESGSRSRLIDDARGRAVITPKDQYEAVCRIGSILFRVTVGIVTQSDVRTLLDYKLTITDVINAHVIYSASVDSDIMQGRTKIPTRHARYSISDASVIERLGKELGGTVTLDYTSPEI